MIQYANANRWPLVVPTKSRLFPDEIPTRLILIPRLFLCYNSTAKVAPTKTRLNSDGFPTVVILKPRLFSWYNPCAEKVIKEGVAKTRFCPRIARGKFFEEFSLNLAKKPVLAAYISEGLLRRMYLDNFIARIMGKANPRYGKSLHKQQKGALYGRKRTDRI